MFMHIDNFKLLDILNGESVAYRTFENRFSHAFAFKISGESFYTFENKTLTLKQGEMIFIPKGASYSVKRVCDKSEYVLINFDAAMPENTAKVYAFDKYPDLSFIHKHLAKLWLFGDTAEKYTCYATFYNILSYISTKDKPQYTYVKKTNKIENAVNFIHTNIFNCNLRVDELHTLCGMSDTYFRKIFKATFGTTPQQYIINKRMAHARSIISSGDYNSIGEVAQSVGYNDALFFSRIFSKKYGICPSEYAQKHS